MTARSAASCYCSNASRPAAQLAQYASCLRVTRALAPCTRAQALVRRWRSCRAYLRPWEENVHHAGVVTLRAAEMRASLHTVFMYAGLMSGGTP